MQRISGLPKAFGRAAKAEPSPEPTGTPVSADAAGDVTRETGHPGFARFAWFLLWYNIPVILFGAFVRATGSGAGCGSHWPLCNGEVIPRPEQIQTLIEFSHRMMSGLDGLFVLALLVGAFRTFGQGHRVRYAAIFTLFFTITEALIGAALVRFNWVVDDASIGRAIVLPLHMANTFFLLGALGLTAWWASGRDAIRLQGQGAVAGALLLALVSSLFLGMSGVITALGDTLFPVHSTAEAISQGLAPGAHFLVKLRLLHPLIAMSVGLYLMLVTGLVSHLRPSPEVKRLARALVSLFAFQMVFGLLNKIALAPVWMQIVHLLLADLIWLNLILLSAASLAKSAPQVELSAIPESPYVPGRDPAADTGSVKATWKDYVVLTKPKVISLLLFTTLAAMFIAQDETHRVTPFLFLMVAIGGYMSAGAANAINMVIDRDIDGRMKRTSTRPTVTLAIPSNHALIFGFSLALGSFVLLAVAANLLAAMLSLAGLFFYVIVYTLLLKRRTWHNTVIGGAAGAFPPLVGWAAVTGDLAPLAWVLFTIVFLWTPVHFWALALLIKDDYAEVGVPMLPVVLGERVTVIQIGLYAVLTAIISVLPLLTHEVRWVYLIAAVLLNVLLLVRSLQLYRSPGRPRAVSLYKYSMLYLALLFVAMAADRMIWG